MKSKLFASLALGVALFSTVIAGSLFGSSTAHATSATPAACIRSDIQVVSANTDLSNVTVKLKTYAQGKTCSVSLNSYAAEGLSWATSGNQTLSDHKTVTVTGTQTGTLMVTNAPCFFQNDLYLGTTRHDGVDGNLPHYPTTAFDDVLIKAAHGGAACEVTPAAPSANDVCGTAQDSYTIPTTAHVDYQINGQTVAAGTYPATGSVTITAVAKGAAYVISNGAVKSWTFTFTNEACPTAHITASAVCSADGVTVTLKNSGNADGTAVVNGSTVSVKAGETKTVTVATTDHKAAVKVTFNGQTIYDQTVDCTPGNGGGTPETPTTPSTPVTTAPQVLPATLPATGASTPRSPFGLIMATLLTYGAVYFLWNRHDFAFLTRQLRK